MEEIFSAIAEGWDNGFADASENVLSQDIISDSISKANDFFYPDGSFGLSGESTMHGDGYSVLDDSLYNCMQLDSFGITGQEALDMALAYEGTSQMLHEMDYGFSSHQGELCCDFMAGVRAGVNDTDVSQMTDFLNNQPYSEGHTLGLLRADIMEEGFKYAQDYMDGQHDSPNFAECLDQFQESHAKEYSEIAKLMDDRYSADCEMLHYKDLLKNGVDGFDSLEDCEDAIRKYYAASAEYGRLSNELSFKSRESMLPYEELSTIYPLEHPEHNPFGVYIMYHSNGAHPVETFQKPDLPNDFLDREPKEGTKLLQNACDAMCDAAGIRHIKVFLTDNTMITKNAAHHPGGFLFTYIDDTLYLNRDYARDCIQYFGNTDSLLVDMAHEIGHAVNMVHCGRLDRKSDETLADMFSTILTSMMGIDIEVSREWNLKEYDGVGSDEYKPSEGRWDIEAAGKYWTELSTIKTYIDAIEDPHFRELVYNYKTDSIIDVYDMAQKELDYQINEAGGSKDMLRKGFDHVLKYLSLYVTRI